MNENPFDIVHAVTIKRKPKSLLIPESVFTSDYHSNCIQLKENHPPNLMPWRVISSGVVARGSPLILQNPSTAESSSYFENEQLTNVKLPKNYNWTEGLRTPMRNKPKTMIESDSAMTRNCEQLFSRMSTFKVEKPELNIDPSQSVRRIIKGSGLLKTFGTGLMNDDEPDEDTIPASTPETTHQMSITTSFSSEPESDPIYLDSSQCSTIQPDKNSSFQLFSSQSVPSPPDTVFFDTVVMRKTVETEFVEYFPPKKEFQLFTTSCDLKRSSSDVSPLAMFKKRPRYEYNHQVQ